MKLFPDPLDVSVLWKYDLPLAVSIVLSLSPVDQIRWVGTLAFALLMFWGIAYLIFSVLRVCRFGLVSTSAETAVILALSLGIASISYTWLHGLWR